MSSENEVQTTDKKFSAGDICFTLGKELGLSIVNNESENIGWYRFKKKDNKGVLIKYVNNIANKITYKDLNDLLDDIQKLIVVYKTSELEKEYKYLTIDTKKLVKKDENSTKNFFKIKNDNLVGSKAIQENTNIPYGGW